MKWRTEVEASPLKRKIDYGTKIFTVGSCFAQNIAERLSRAKLSVAQSPLGILFNPASIAKSLTDFSLQKQACEARLVCRDFGWVTLDAHSTITAPTKEGIVEAYNRAITEGHKALSSAECVVITLGTAWVYRHKATGEVVANCHKVAQSEFERYRLSVEQIIDLFEPLFEGILADKQVIFTISPIRHISDGAADNSLSKATLRLAVAALCEKFANAEYFPAYEIVIDDLRDYRFYADDLVHPSTQAVEYIWQKFIDAALSSRAKQLLVSVEKIVAAAAHRATNPQSEEYRAFCRKSLEAAKSISEVDFSEECAFFEQFCHKS